MTRAKFTNDCRQGSVNCCKMQLPRVFVALVAAAAVLQLCDAACDESSQFPCNNGDCISADKVCDFVEDCENDEVKCATCTFEDLNTCGWTNIEFAADQPLMWRASESIGTPKTGYMMVSESPLKASKSGPAKAIMQSPISGPTAPSCAVTFKYHVDTDSSNGVTLTFGTVNRSDTPVRLWSQQINWNQTWTSVTVPIGFRLRDSKFQFEAVLQQVTSPLPVVAVDDVDFTRCNVNEFVEAVNCDFESNCEWFSDRDTDVQWVVSSGHEPSQGVGPTFDHTFSNQTGRYALLPTASSSTAKQAARLSSAVVQPSFGSSCFTFWYHMFGVESERLNLLMRYQLDNSATSQVTLPLWTRAKSAGNEWKYAQVPIYGELPYMLVFEGFVGQQFLSEMALDDIALLQGACKPLGWFECDFEVDLCQMESKWYSSEANNQPDVLSWSQKSAAELVDFDFLNPADHTTDTSDGFVIFTSLKKSLTGLDSVTLLSSNISGLIGTVCISFYYQLHKSVDLLVHVVQTDGQQSQFTVEQLDSRNRSWHFSQFQATVSTEFRIEFTAKCNLASCTEEPNAIAVIDDIYVDNDACKKPASCDFERDLCSYSNEAGEGTLKWLRNAGRTITQGTGPVADVTYRNDKGFYAYVPAYKAFASKSALLTSETFSPTNTNVCFRFYYHMFGTDIGSLKVSVRVATREPIEVDIVGNQGDKWRQSQIDVGIVNGSWQVVFTAEVRGDLGDIAIDNLEIYDTDCKSQKCLEGYFPCEEGECVDGSKVCDFKRDCTNGRDEQRCGQCTFEDESTCGWLKVTDPIEEILAWSLSKGKIADHTSSTTDGGYLTIAVIDNRKQREDDIPRIRIATQVLGPIQSACSVSFWYYMARADANEGVKPVLSLGTVNGTGQEQRTLWWTDTYNNRWVNVIVPIGFRLRNTKLQFEVIMGDIGDSALPDIALDDVSYENCNPNEQPSLPVSCDFESECGWYDDTDTDVKWTLASGHRPSSGAGPTFDHTLGDQSGHYIYLPTANASLNSVARVASITVEAPRSAHCFSFWYHMFGMDVQRLNVLQRYTPSGDDTSTDALTQLIWSRSKSTGNVWNYAQTTVMGEEPFSIVFEGFVGASYLSEIAIDDVVLRMDEPCAQQSSSECDFEYGTCGFTSKWVSPGNDSLSDQSSWIWTQVSQLTYVDSVINEADHTTDLPDGYVMFTSLGSVPAEQSAYLQSPRFNVTQTFSCITFFYQVDTSVELTVQSISATDGTRVTLWNSSQELLVEKLRTWHFAQFQIEGQGTYQVAFIARCKAPTCFGNNNSVSLIDDVLLNNSYCPNLGNCNFERDFCAYTNKDKLGRGTLSWLRNAGSTTTEGTGPANDQTTGTEAGFYAYVPAYQAFVGLNATIISETFHATNQPVCVRFWYHMNGSSIGSLTASVITNSVSANWQLAGNQGDEWHQAEVGVESLSSPWRIEFSAQIAGPYGDIALDEIDVQSKNCSRLSCLSGLFECSFGVCIQPDRTCNFISDCPDAYDEANCGACDFEDSRTCGWDSVFDFDFPLLSWRRITGRVPDHTGWCMVMSQADVVPAPTQRGSVAVVSLRSAQLGPVPPQCRVSFQYYMSKDEASDNCSASLVLTIVNGNMSFTLWNSTSLDASWQLAVVPIRFAQRGAMLQFNAEITGYVAEQPVPLVAIDDVAYVDCSWDAQPSVTPNCDFESECNWFVDSDSAVPWVVHSGHTTTAGTGPTFDHTLLNQTGHYLYMPTANATAKNSARVSSAVLDRHLTAYCFSFWYHMFGMDVEKLQVFLRLSPTEDSNELPIVKLWSRSNSMGNQWRFAQFSIISERPYTIVFEGFVGKTYLSEIAIDDIVLDTTGGCKELSWFECDFEVDDCGFVSKWLPSQPAEEPSDFSWSRRSMADLATYQPLLNEGDHTTGLPDGMAMFSSLYNAPTSLDRVQLQSPVVNMTGPVCITFFFEATHDVILQSSVLDEKGLNEQIKWTSDVTIKAHKNGEWHFAQFQVDAVGPFRVAFTLACSASNQCQNSNVSVTVIDDFYLTNNACPSDGSCDFERDTCAYYNKPVQEPIAKWLRNAGATVIDGTGPSTDVTTQSDAGFYLYVPAEQEIQDSIAILKSEYFPATNTNICYRFWYHMYGPDVGLLRVIASPTDSDFWLRVGDQGNKWHQDQLDLGFVNESWWMTIEADFAGSKGEVAIDEITVHSKSCAELPCLSGFSACLSGSCIYEYQFCDFKSDCGDGSDELNCGHCTFDGSLCGWTGVNTSEPVSWMISKIGDTMSALAVVYTPKSMKQAKKISTFAKVKTPIVGPLASQCSLSFWYYFDLLKFNGSATLEFSVVHLNDGTSEKVLWSTNKSTNQKWVKAHVHVGRLAREYYFQFKASFEGLLDAEIPIIGVDNFEYQACTYLNRTIGSPSDMTCNFAHGWCGWHQETINDISWVRQAGHSVRNGTGPFADADGQQSGRYLYVPSYKAPLNDTTRVISETLGGSVLQDTICMSFAYHMFGTDVNQQLRLLSSVLLQTDETYDSKKVYFTATRHHGNQWRRAYLNLPIVHDYELVFEAKVGSSPLSGIAIDSVKLDLGGPCSFDPFAVADFETGTFGFDTTSDFYWYVLTAQNFRGTDVEQLLQLADHSTNTEFGYFFGADMRSSKLQKLYYTVSPAYSFAANVPICLRFFYQLGEQVELSVQVEKSAESVEKVWSTMYNQSFGRRWHFAQVTYTPSQDVTVGVAFIAKSSGSAVPTAVAFIDDFQLQVGQECPAITSCSFDDDFCGFSFSDSSAMDWERSAGYQLPRGSTGPALDANNSPIGSYALVQAFEGSAGKAAIMQSDPVVGKEWPTCFSFWYYLSEGVGNLTSRVYSTSSSVAAEWKVTADSDSGWRRKLIDVPAGSYFSVQFDAALDSSTNGSIAIDNTVWYDDRTCAQINCTDDNMLACDGQMKCINRNQVCDFVSDCDDGSDEVNCGQCSFENSTACGWKSSQDSTLVRWTLAKGDLRDHTTDTTNGGYMAVALLGAGVRDQTASATMSTPIQGPIAPACAVTFWYFVYPSPVDQQVVATIKFSATYFDGVTYQPVVLWESNTTASTWSLAHVPIGFRLRNTVFQISADVHNYQGGLLPTIAVDDVSFEYCSSTQQPSTPINCTFESQCGWYVDTDTSVQWIRNSGHTPSTGTGPTFDHTLGNQTGHYIYLPTTDNEHMSAARISSLVLPAIFGPSCLSFWYHMFGMDVERLNVLLRLVPANSDTVVGTQLIWTRVKSNGNKWTYAQAPIFIDEPFTIVFEGFVGSSYLSEIAIDDVTFLPGVPCAPLNQFDCDFEVGDCGFTSSWTSPERVPRMLAWQVRVMESLSDYSGLLGDVDHTTGMSLGSVMFTTLAPSITPSDSVTLLSPLVDFKPAACVTFFYELTSTVQLLAQTLVQTEDGNVTTLAWDSSRWLLEHGGGDWHFGQFQVNSNQSFRIAFVAKCAIDSCTDVATSAIVIDDVYIAPGTCPSTGSCDFERDTCAYTNAAGSAVQWLRNAGATTTLGTGPENDVTTLSDQGFYIYVPSYKGFENDVAILQSETFPVTSTNLCYRFWYHMAGSDVGNLEISIVSTETTKWTISGNQGNRWHQQQVDATLDTIGWKAIIAATITGEKGDIAVDEIIAYNTSCSDLPCLSGSFNCSATYCIESYHVCDFVDDCATGADETDCGACKFDSGNTCGWKATADEGLRWQATSVDTGDSLHKNFYGVVSSSRSSSRSVIEVTTQSPEIGPLSPKCEVTFWYYIQAFEAAANASVVLELAVSNESNSGRRVVWRNTGHTEDRWFQARVHIGRRLRSVVFDMTASYTGVSDPVPTVGFDDFEYINCGYINQPLSTPSDLPCNFTDDSCNWYAETVYDVNWNRQTGHSPLGGSGPATDSINQQEGGYMYAQKYLTPATGHARLTSMTMPANSGAYCLSFSTHMFGMAYQGLDVYARKRANQTDTEDTKLLLWSRWRQHGDEWRMHSVTVSVPFEYELVFEATVTDSFSSGIAIDTIFVNLSAACAVDSYGVSDFESDDNGYFTDPTDPSPVQWVRSSAAALGTLPGVVHTDHTTNTKNGKLFLVNFDNSTAKASALIISPVKIEPGQMVCLSFYYQLTEADLVVLIWSESLTVPLMFISPQNDFGTRWQYGHLNYKVQVDEPVHFAFYAARDSSLPTSAYAMIDDVQVNLDIICTSLPDCNFDGGYCRYSFEASDRLDWERGNGAGRQQGSAAPAVDASDSSTGYYALVLSDASSNGQLVTLTSDIYKKSQAPSCLAFSYYYSSSEVGSLSVKTYGNSIDSELWPIADDVTGEWRHIAIDLPPTTSAVVQFEALLSGSSKGGAIAIDNIVHYDSNDCAKVNCTSPYFSCDNATVCLNDYQVCDFVQDCGDGTDETNCGSCAFGNANSCGWTSLSGSEPLLWTLSNAIADHTTGSDGWSMIVSTSKVLKNRKRSVSPLVSMQTPLFGPSAPACYVSFWYFTAMSTGNPQTIPTLTLATVGSNGNNKTILWTMNASQPAQSKWIYVNVPIGFRLRNTKLQFDAQLIEYAGEPLPTIAVDDVSFEYCSSTQQPSTPINCTFESQCGWYVDTDTSVQWIRNSGHTPSTGTGPTFDHTLGNQTGHYIYLPTTDNEHMSAARISSQVLPAHSPYCFSFWYHMFGMDVERLNVLLRSVAQPNDQEANTQLVWSRVQSSGNVWKYGQVTVFADFPASIVFEAYVGKSFLSEIAVDDISLTTNGPCEQLNWYECSFEVDECRFVSSWNSSLANASNPDVLSWQLRQMLTLTNYNKILSATDHTTGTELGRVMFTTLAPSLTAQDFVLLQSELVLLDGPLCVTFFYEVGPSVRLLANVVTQDGYSTTLWDSATMPVPHTQSVWHYARFQVSVFKPFHIQFVALCATNARCVGAESAVAAIDDFFVDSSMCPTLGSCEFERDTCAYTSIADSATNAIWLRNAGATLTEGTGPSVDVTTHSDAGFYVYVPSSIGLLGSTALLRSDDFPSPNSSVCYRFWYHMYGESSQLQIRATVQPNTPATKIFLGNRGDKWHQDELDLGFVSEPWKAEFSSYISGVTGDVALDKIEVYYQSCSSLNCVFDRFECSLGSCIEPWKACDFLNDCATGYDEQVCGACTFAVSDCDWFSSGKEFIWLRTSKLADHSGDGKTLMVQVDRMKARVSDEELTNVTADTRTRVIGPLASTCKVDFWYYMSYDKVPTSGSLKLEFSVIDMDDLGNESRKVFWSSTVGTNNTWKSGQIFIGKRARNVSLEFMAYFFNIDIGSLPTIALDDISFINCSYLNQVSDPSGLNCDFTNGWCAWNQETTFDSSWVQQSGHADRDGTGPVTDADGQRTGKYLYLFASPTSSKVSRITSIPVAMSAGLNCVEFSYHMFGPETKQTLNVYIRPKANQTSQDMLTKVWSSSRQHGNTWQRARVEPLQLDNTVDQEVVFEAIVGTSSFSGIAIDSTLLDTSGGCVRPTNTLATFDYSRQDYVPGGADYFCWHYYNADSLLPFNVQSYLQVTDHTANSDSLGYMGCELSGAEALLLSPAYNVRANTTVCYRFFYQIYESGVLTLQLRVLDSKSQATRIDPLWTTKFATSFAVRWRYAQAEFTVQRDQTIQMGFSTYKSTTTDQRIAFSLIDDAEIMIGSKCPPILGCSFDDDFCSFSYVETNRLDWERSRGADLPKGVTAPALDAADPFSGAYAFLEASASTYGITTALQSDAIVGNSWPTCVSFSYYLNGNSIGTVTASVYTKSNAAPVKSVITGSQGPQWLKKQMDIPSADMVVLDFTGAFGAGTQGTMALDDVVYYADRNCSLVGAVCPEFTCQKQFQCVQNDNVCDFTSQCTDASDEAACGECNFDDADSCSWQNVNGNKIDWRIENGLVTGQKDHTTGTSSGYAMYVSSNTSSLTPTSSFITTASRMPLGPFSKTCTIEFWYKITCGGLTKCNAEASLLLVNQLGYETTLWVQSEPSSNWKRVSIPVHDRAKEYYFKFSADFQVDRDITTDIGIDDIAYFNCASAKPSATAANCNFESNFCSWQGTETAFGDWKRQTGNAALSGEGPLTDHTLLSPAGTYAFVPTNQTILFAGLAAGPLPQMNDSCFTFFYHMRGLQPQSLTLFSKSADPGKPKTATLLWAQAFSEGNEWIGVSVPINTDQTFELIFDGYVVKSPLSDVAIDDTVLTALSSCTIRDTDCTFEADLCKFTAETSSSVSSTWRLVAAAETSSDYNSLPGVDRSSGMASSNYVLSDLTTADKSVNAVLYTGWSKPASDSSCYSFYYVVGPDCVLDVFLTRRPTSGSPSDETSLVGSFISVNDLLARWHVAKISVNVQSNYIFRFKFVARRISGDTALDNAAIAIDYAKLSPSACEAPATCNFEKGLCDFENLAIYSEDEKSISWIRTTSAALPSSVRRPTGDDSNNGLGNYIMLPLYNGAANKVAQLESETLAASDVDRCFAFSYQQTGADVGTLQIFSTVGGKEESPIKIIGDHGNVWSPVSVNIPKGNSWKVLLQATLGSGTSGYIALDNFVLDNTGCNSCFRCHREAKCIALDKVCDFFPDCSDGSDEDQCASSCNFDSSESTTSDSDLCYWKPSNYRPSSVPADYVQMSWSVLTMSLLYPLLQSPDGILLVDKSMNSPLGKVLAATASSDSISSGKHSFAVLRSPLLRDSGSQCTFSFNYRTIGGNNSAAAKPSELAYEVSLHVLPDAQESGLIELWRSSYARPDLLSDRSDWINVKLQLPASYALFQLQITVITHPKTTAIAIDSLYFEACARRQTDDCSTYGFSCQSDNVCVAKDSLCDLHYDCLDKSDESSSQCKDFYSCTFNNDQCDFFVNQTGPNLQWSRTQLGSTPNGPLASHSSDNWYLSTSFTTVQNQEEALLALNYRPLNANCQLRFWYQFFNDKITNKQASAQSPAFGVLNVYALSANKGSNALNATLLDSLSLLSSSRLSWSKQTVSLSNVQVTGADAQLVLSARVFTYGTNPAWFAIDDITLSSDCLVLPASRYPLLYSRPVEVIVINETVIVEVTQQTPPSEDDNTTEIILAVLLGICVLLLILTCIFTLYRSHSFQIWRRNWTKGNMMTNPLYDMDRNEFAVSDYGMGRSDLETDLGSVNAQLETVNAASTSGNKDEPSSSTDSQPRGTNRETAGTANLFVVQVQPKLEIAESVGLDLDVDLPPVDQLGEEMQNDDKAKLELSRTPPEKSSGLISKLRAGRY